ncbi:hypothetical protein SteCoe_7582 [Stentor coeruleus]|uniref:Prefoldin subunit 1 n=1 Tax=Stentor coeruleus TaxID=5963 RepID=A0A1R2CM53_9CILI|nr:hypothetical protein SteCoe_7582 [Stentor coeruleus]
MNADSPSQQALEVQSMLFDIINSIKLNEANIMALEAERRRFQLTIAEVNNQQDDAVLYRPVGRAYVMKTKDEILLDINNSIRRCEGELDEQLKKKEVIIKRRDEFIANNQ